MRLGCIFRPSGLDNLRCLPVTPSPGVDGLHSRTCTAVTLAGSTGNANPVRLYRAFCASDSYQLSWHAVRPRIRITPHSDLNLHESPVMLRPLLNASVSVMRIVWGNTHSSNPMVGLLRISLRPHSYCSCTASALKFGYRLSQLSSLSGLVISEDLETEIRIVSAEISCLILGRLKQQYTYITKYRD